MEGKLHLLALGSPTECKQAYDELRTKIHHDKLGNGDETKHWIPTLLLLLKSEKEEVKRKVVSLLKEIGPATKKQVDELLFFLNEEEPDIIKWALMSLKTPMTQKKAREVSNKVLPFLASESISVRNAAAEVLLSVMYPMNPSFVEQLPLVYKILELDRSKVKQEEQADADRCLENAILLLARCHQFDEALVNEIGERLLPFLSHENANVREAAVRALHDLEYCERAYIDVLAGRLKTEPNKNIRKYILFFNLGQRKLVNQFLNEVISIYKSAYHVEKADSMRKVIEIELNHLSRKAEGMKRG
ncbi:HEAT repeat domain-containing protein [Bacillus sp. B15-48]|uniref:HEAT repeat domain-containing protein n=1 Tax=Bacillus sp. B15-48 TaxID=1548601 RepID=UPI00193FA4D3|nr:HEAT repeat domain-containing protein [Bacillus sp. B15-48]MBM4760993.1 hypothetical protein [Bacillus sp. B15-48]